MASVPTLPSAKTIEMKDHVATTIIQRYWAVPGLLDKQLAALDVGGSVLGGLASSRLDKIMVRDEKIAVAVSAQHDAAAARRHLLGQRLWCKPGVDPAVVVEAARRRSWPTISPRARPPTRSSAR